MDFIDFARIHGVDARGVTPSDRIQRVPTVEKPRSKNGAVLWDGVRGWVMDWAGGREIHWYGSDQAPDWTDEQRREWARKREAQRLRDEQSRQRAARRAADLLARTTLTEHGYLRLKGFPDQKGLVLPDEVLMVPMRDLETNDLVGAQLIRWVAEDRRWDKLMLTGMRAKGAVLRIGDRRAREVCLCEGFATGLSIAEAVRVLRLNAAVLVTFSATNLVHVAGRLKSPALVVADNDESGVGESAAKATGLRYCMSDRVGEDANDLHQRAGVFSLAQMLMAARRHGWAT